MAANVIAVDGPAGAGKSTVAKILAQKLDYLYIDTGAMYRVVALCAIRQGIAFDDEAGLKDICDRITIRLESSADSYKVFCNDEDVTLKIRTPEVSAAASPVSAAHSVRIAMVAQQRLMSEQGNVIMDGRDIGTNVFPDADCKIFLTASLDERAHRRTLELQAKGFEILQEQVAKDLTERDFRDSNRDFAPLKKADDAVEIDSTSLAVDEVVSKIIKIIAV